MYINYPIIKHPSNVLNSQYINPLIQQHIPILLQNNIKHPSNVLNYYNNLHIPLIYPLYNNILSSTDLNISIYKDKDNDNDNNINYNEIFTKIITEICQTETVKIDDIKDNIKKTINGLSNINNNNNDNVKNNIENVVNNLLKQNLHILCKGVVNINIIQTGGTIENNNCRVNIYKVFDENFINEMKSHKCDCFACKKYISMVYLLKQSIINNNLFGVINNIIPSFINYKDYCKLYYIYKDYNSKKLTFFYK